MRIDKEEDGLMTLADLTGDEVAHIMTVLGWHGRQPNPDNNKDWVEMTKQSTDMFNEMMLKMTQLANTRGTTRPFSEEDTQAIKIASKLMNGLSLTEEEYKLFKTEVNKQKAKEQ